MSISFEHEGLEYRVFDALYAVSRDGKVLRKFKPYKPAMRTDGYLKCGGYGRLLHRMIAILWVNNPDGGKVVHHINGNKTDNRADNLEWLSQSEHAKSHCPNDFGNYVRSETTRQKLRLFRTGFKDMPEIAARKRAILDANCPKRPCEIDGVFYRSIRQASIILNIHISTVRQRCLSKHFPNYKLLT